MSKNEQHTEPSPELTPSRRKALLELLGDVIKAQEKKPEELKVRQQRLVELLQKKGESNKT